jgi:hypothetical protein
MTTVPPAAKNAAIWVRMTRAMARNVAFACVGEMTTRCDSPGEKKRVSAVDDVVKAVLAGERRIVAVDVEATCWKKGVFSRKKETIEIGAVLLLIDRAESKWPEFQTFVRPMRLPRLSSCGEAVCPTQGASAQ